MRWRSLARVTCRRKTAAPCTRVAQAQGAHGRRQLSVRCKARAKGLRASLLQANRCPWPRTAATVSLRTSEEQSKSKWARTFPECRGHLSWEPCLGQMTSRSSDSSYASVPRLAAPTPRAGDTLLGSSRSGSRAARTPGCESTAGAWR